MWSRDGTRLFFISPERKMMSVEVRNPAGPVPEFGRPVALFDARISGHPFELFDVASDGRFLMPVPSAQRESEPITVILNWPALGN